jgi:copper chaperone
MKEKAVAALTLHKNVAPSQTRTSRLDRACALGRIIRRPGGVRPMTSVSIPDMSCNHCKAAVTTALAEVPGVTNVEIDLDLRTARVAGSAQLLAILSALERAGYPASPTE